MLWAVVKGPGPVSAREGLLWGYIGRLAAAPQRGVTQGGHNTTATTVLPHANTQPCGSTQLNKYASQATFFFKAASKQYFIFRYFLSTRSVYLTTQNATNVK